MVGRSGRGKSAAAESSHRQSKNNDAKSMYTTCLSTENALKLIPHNERRSDFISIQLAFSAVRTSKIFGHLHDFNKKTPKTSAISTVPLCSTLFRQKILLRSLRAPFAGLLLPAGL